ncbi:MAG: class I SAM-dependent methyltransferase [Sandaracinaceae bacterium]|nr:class I SAM-dependent methyltransferase [Sandaracinaceae bacterium]
MADKVTVLFEDYRDLRGTFDKLVSLEMIEAVGAEYLDTYSAKGVEPAPSPPGSRSSRRPSPSDDNRYRPRGWRGLHQALHLPGLLHPQPGVMTSAVARTTDLRVTSLEDLGSQLRPHAEQWISASSLSPGARPRLRRALPAALDAVPGLLRGGFRGAAPLSNVRLLFAKPSNRRAQFLPGSHTG